MNTKHLMVGLAFLFALLTAHRSTAQSTFAEDFTGASTSHSWYFFNGACLTSSSASAGTSPGQVPGCTAVKSAYYFGENLVGGQNGVSGNAQTLPDPANAGALRFTNGYPFGKNEGGAIISATPFDATNGLQITFKSVTYRGDSGGGVKDGADGISFFMMDGSVAPSIGSQGGSLSYTCSNPGNIGGHPNINGVVGAYIGLGIDEYGNFLNAGDNTATGFGQQGNRIGLRGNGNVGWSYLNSNYPAYYPSSLTSAQQQAAVAATCQSGYLWDYSTPSAPKAALNGGTTISIPDYQAIPGGNTTLSGVNIANESAMNRGAATPIFYNLKITSAGVLSLSYSLSGAAYQAIITNQDVTLYSGTMPRTLLFGFAGSTGGSTNIHEIMCFKAAPQNTSGSSASVNEKESAKAQSTSQAFFAFYNPGDWSGTLTANTLIDTAGVVTVNPVANWDAGCLLSGTGANGCATTNVAGPTSAAPAPASRVMLTWDTANNVGIPFEWTSPGLNTSEQNTLDALDSTPTASRLFFLRGSRTNEVNPKGVGLYRSRASVLGDIVDSSPTWVGPANLPYTATWADRLQTGDSMVENSGTQNYQQYVTAELSRLNVVYVGANDGFLHGFRAGTLDSNGLLTNDGTNDGREVLAYMPGSLLQSAANPTVPATTPPSCTDHSHTQSVVQNIRGVTPAIGGSPLCVDNTLDFSNPQYGHNFFVDATPGAGDLFYGGVWHTWLVGGLGAGGAAIYALDVTNPGNFTQGNASSLVVGEWNASTIACSPSCAGNLGNTYGVPQIRRLHNGKWGVIFGNGFGSTTGDAGIYVMTIDVNSSGAPVESFYYLSTHTGTGTASTPCASNCDGIAYVTPVDLDGDHVTDYVYAGDLKGNVWRFDLTGTDPTTWAAASAPLFTTPPGQPITSQLLAISTSMGGPQRLMIEFSTGLRTQVTNTTPVGYASGTQAIYGIWDWNLTGWNGMSGTQYASLAATAEATGLTAPYTIPSSGSPIASLTQQTFTINTSTEVRDGTNVAICWQGSTACTSGDSKFGWYANLPGSSEQVISNPVYFQGAILVDSVVPASNVPTSCSTNLDAGFTYAISVANGGIFTNAFPTFTRNGVLVPDSSAAGVRTDATGSVYPVKTVEGTSNIVYQTVTGGGGSQKVNIPPNTRSKRLTWIERR